MPSKTKKPAPKTAAKAAAKAKTKVKVSATTLYRRRQRERGLQRIELYLSPTVAPRVISYAETLSKMESPLQERKTPFSDLLKTLHLSDAPTSSTFSREELYADHD